MTKPNIIYLHSHDTGRMIEPYGYPVHTPNLAAFAAEAVVFRNAFSAAPTCSPSRAALVTGLSPHVCGMTGPAHRGFRLTDYRQHIVSTLKRNGYHSALSGIQHVAAEPRGYRTIGYDERIGDSTDAETKAAEFLRRTHRDPFFLSVGFFETHREFPELDSPSEASTAKPVGTLPDCPETRVDAARFAKSVRILDNKLGVVLEALDSSKYRDNTLVIVTTDHGPAFPGMKCTLTDAGTGVMLMMRGPGPFSQPTTVDAMVSQLDIVPTIHELLQTTSPASIEGRSLVPLLNGSAGSLHEALFSEVSYHAAYEPMRAVRTERFKYIRRFDGRTRPVMANCDDGESKSYLVENGWGGRTPAGEELYDLVFDPFETHNIVENPRRRDVVEDMQNRLQLRMEQTKDPLLMGWVSAPEGAKLNDPDSPSPSSPAVVV